MAWNNVTSLTAKVKAWIYAKASVITVNLANISYGAQWKTSQVIASAVSLYRKNNNNSYICTAVKNSELIWTITNKSEGNTARNTFSGKYDIFSYGTRGWENFNRPYTISSSEGLYLAIRIYTTGKPDLNHDNWNFTVVIYINGVAFKTIVRNHYGNDAGTQIPKVCDFSFSDGDYIHGGYCYTVIVPDALFKTPNKTISATVTQAGGSLYNIKVSIVQPTTWISTASPVVTYNDTLIYAFEQQVY